MHNPAVKRITALLAALVIAAILTPAGAADYVKKATWTESMLAAREASIAERAKNPKSAPKRRRRNPNAPLWAFLQKTFTDSSDAQEMAWEIEDHIWTADWKPGTAAPSLARHYASATKRLSPKHGELVAKLLPRAKNAAGLARVRKVYLQARLHHAAITKIKQLNLSGMRTMITQLASKGAKVSKHLARLNTLHDQGIDSHRPNATGNRCVGGATIFNAFQFDVAHTAGVIACIHYHGAILDPFSFNKLGLTYSANNNIGLFDVVGQVLSA
jgi:hypothetical protein